MSMYFVGIDISKYKHDCCIISAADQKVVSKFTFQNDTSKSKIIHKCNINHKFILLQNILFIIRICQH